MKRRMIIAISLLFGFFLLFTTVFIPQQMIQAQSQQCYDITGKPIPCPSNNSGSNKPNYRNPTKPAPPTNTPTPTPLPVVKLSYPPPYASGPLPYVHGPYPTVPHPPICAVPCWLIPPQPWEEVELGGLIIVVFGAGFLLFRKMSGPGGGD